MKHIDTLIIGAGQAGLAMSHCLAERSIDHVVIERGQIANSWRYERWDSLRLLTPNWQSRLPGYRYHGDDPDGFMSMPEVTEFLTSYARINSAPVEENTLVQSVTSDAAGYRVTTGHGDWLCRNLVVASGACNLANLPAMASALPRGMAQFTPLSYRNPTQIPQGGVLVVGASASGVQLAAELRTAGHEVTLCVGEHVRVPRHYRGRDIQWWMDQLGLHDVTTDQVDDLIRARHVPSLQLVGNQDQHLFDLNFLQGLGVEIVGRLTDIRDNRALFSGALANVCTLSDLKMNRLLGAIDDWVQDHPHAATRAAERFVPTRCPAQPRLSHDLGTGQFRSVIWATGLRPDHSWLDLPVFDAKGRLQHDQGKVAPGLYVLGLPFLRHRNSTLIDGVGVDARALADHILTTRRQVAA